MRLNLRLSPALSTTIQLHQRSAPSTETILIFETRCCQKPIDSRVYDFLQHRLWHPANYTHVIRLRFYTHTSFMYDSLNKTRRLNLSTHPCFLSSPLFADRVLQQINHWSFLFFHYFWTGQPIKCADRSLWEECPSHVSDFNWLSNQPQYRGLVI